MTDQRIPQFLTIKEACELLNVAPSTLAAAIDTGKLPALRLGESHMGTRINRDDLIPVNTRAADLRTRRLRKLAMEARDAREAVARKRLELADAEGVAEAAARALEHELALDEIDQAADRRHVA